VSGVTAAPLPLVGVADLRLDLSTLAGVLAVLVGAYVTARVVAAALSVAAEYSVSRRIGIKLFIPVVKFAIYGTALYLVLGPLLRLSAAQLLAVSGLLGAALGFGLRDLVAGVIGGLVVIVEKPYRVGDKVRVGDDYGEVTDISLRATRLVTDDDATVVVPNAAFFTENVANANSGSQELMAVVELTVAPGADVERAADIVEEALVTSAYVYVDDDHPVVVRVEDNVYHRTIEGKAYVADLRDEFAFTSDVTRRALAAFEEAGIETPKPPGRVPGAE
jgi:small-conductance mechanosensitive channel